MESIGGYFGFAFSPENEYHQTALRLNTARNALEYILKANSYSKIYLPFFICDVVLQPIKRRNVNFEFYHIDENLEPIFAYERIGEKEVLLYVNYFGLKDSFIRRIHKRCLNLIVDNSQSFYSRPIAGVDTIYSARKFFGVPDGAYLYTNRVTGEVLKKDISFNRCTHLLKRPDIGAEGGFNDFQKNEQYLNNLEILEMSNLTQSILRSIDYKQGSIKRRQNYDQVRLELECYNQLDTKVNHAQTPFVYPFLTDDPGLRAHLLNNRVYVSQYWPNVLSWVEKDSFEFKLAANSVHIPIDERYGREEMLKIIQLVKKYL